MTIKLSNKHKILFADIGQCRSVIPEQRETKIPECPNILFVPQGRKTQKEHRDLTELKKQNLKFEANDVTGI